MLRRRSPTRRRCLRRQGEHERTAAAIRVGRASARPISASERILVERRLRRGRPRMSTQIARDDVFMFDRGAETMSRDALTALQVERAKRTLEHAYANVPLYR